MRSLEKIIFEILEVIPDTQKFFKEDLLNCLELERDGMFCPPEICHWGLQGGVELQSLISNKFKSYLRLKKKLFTSQ